MGFDLNGEPELVYEALIHAVQTNSGIGFYNNDQGHPAYMLDESGKASTAMGDSPRENRLYQMLESLTYELGESAHTPVRSWHDFCRLAYDAYRQHGGARSL